MRNRPGQEEKKSKQIKGPNDGVSDECWGGGRAEREN